MVGWIILGVFVLIIVAINLIRVGADVSFEDGQFSLSAKVAGVLIQLFPKEDKGEPKPKKEKKPRLKKKEKPKDEEEKPKKKGLPLGMNKEELFELVKKVLRLLGKFPGKFRIDRFKLHYLAAGGDPYNTAVTYGYVNEALSVLLPLARNTFTVKDSDVRTEIDFTQEQMKIDFGLALTIRIGQIVGLVFAIGFAGLGVIVKSKRRQKKDAKAAAAEEKRQTGLPDEIEKEHTDTIQAEERMDSNG